MEYNLIYFLHNDMYIEIYKMNDLNSQTKFTISIGQNKEHNCEKKIDGS